MSARRRRLIPAHAGKMSRLPRRAAMMRAHPRSRGENPGVAHGSTSGSGSSPLTRGKCEPGADHLRRRRLIPAHAGKIRSRSRSMRNRRAHPRSRGENGPRVRGDGVGDGSSPLTRGKCRPRPGGCARTRLIPAHAGKIRRGPCGHGVAPAHPRSRGENRSTCAVFTPAQGSSPLTRGKFVDRHEFGGLAGLIPAHAGKMAAR